ncbi:hypothetical protein POM88_006205 [Heracleum sosnowskyi]|uniref:Malectin-like domain-containing protein n=1 Tax=Heracleum sosnowskyi TaxID=360622 RepID=A0AAD8J5K2_9APIA|nr:hypothetical protein POM88_006205 [Heracleum sosnowskyi]
MKKAKWMFLTFLAMHFLSSSSQEPDTSRWEIIDCGADGVPFNDDLLIWHTDDGYIQTGSNELVRTKATRNEFNTLRAFPDKERENCYSMSSETQTLRYIIRVGFYYGNYDGLSKPPKFDLFINNVKWATVDTSINNGEPFYEEIIYHDRASGFFRICLVKIKGGGIPLINSIEIMVVYDELYPEMERGATYNLVARTNLGGPEVRYDIDTDEMYNRIWSKDASPYARVSGFPNLVPTYENHPPIPILGDAIVSNAYDPITLTINRRQSTPQSAYIVLYFTDLGDPFNSRQTTTLKIEINSQDQGIVNATGYGETTVITKYPVMVSGPTINITLSRADELSLPPMIAAMEVFTKWDAGPDTSRWQSIDCGREVLRLDDALFTWDANRDYTQTGINKLVRINTTRDEFNTLRAFPNNTKDNCYNVPIDTETIRYIIRVGFYYGNYDGLSRPPTFDLFINNIKWTTINTSTNDGEPVYEEIIYYNKGSGFFKICLVHIQDGGIPIINSIETVGVFHVLYPKMETNATYSLVTRINFGGPEVRYDLETDEIYNRIWSKGATPYANVSGLPTNLAPTFENHPPRSVMADAIESNASDPITLTIDLPQLTSPCDDIAEPTQLMDTIAFKLQEKPKALRTHESDDLAMILGQDTDSKYVTIPWKPKMDYENNSLKPLKLKNCTGDKPIQSVDAN